MEAFWSWLAGFIDGEGTIWARHRANRGNHGELDVGIDVTNSEPGVIKYIMVKLDQADIKYYFRNVKRNQMAAIKTSRPIYRIIISGHNEIEKLLLLIQDHLVLKKEECTLLLEIIKQRKHFRRMHQMPWITPEESRAVKRVIFLKKNGRMGENIQLTNEHTIKVDLDHFQDSKESLQYNLFK